MIRKLLFDVTVCLLATVVWAQQLTPLEPDRTQRIATLLLETATKIEGRQVKFEHDLAKAVGLRGNNSGMIAVPRAGLSEEDTATLGAAKKEPGVGVAYLFLSPQFSPVIEGKRVDPKKLRMMKIKTPEGEEREIVCLLLAARQLNDDEWRLYVYGSEPKPLMEPQIGDATSPKPAPLSIDVTNTEGTQGDLVITLLGKYSAKIRMDFQAR